MGSQSESPYNPHRLESSSSSLKPRSAVPSHLLNGDAHNGKTASRTSIRAKERERLAASIISTNKRQEPISLEDLNGYENHNAPSPLIQQANSEIRAKDSQDEAQTVSPVNSRPASPYTLNPPIDFDGLSWPSKHPECQSSTLRI